MTTPLVTEIRLALEPVSPDRFIADLDETVGQDGGAPLRPADATGEVLRRED